MSSESERTFTIETSNSECKIYAKLNGHIRHDLIIFHHGAGYTSQTWSQLIQSLQTVSPSLSFLTFDMRGHGKSSSSKEYNLSSLVNDASEVLKKVLADTEEKVIEIFLVGHSLGAAVLAALPDKFKESNGVIFSGLVMIDIIEETAKKSLSRMPDIVKDIPKSFQSIEMALKWNLSSSHSHHNPQAASKHIEAITAALASRLEYNEEISSYQWITDLSLMASFWNEWFIGLTNNFLKFPGSRLLILADTDYMDKEMMVAQMQGKFQLSIVRESGHAIQEDRPEESADIINGLIQKHMKLSQILRNK